VKVLITGAHGQVGRALTNRAPAGAELTTLAHQDLDIGDERAVGSFVEKLTPDLIINAAAYTAVEKAESDVDTATRVNVAGSRNLAQAASKSNARLIHLSTDFVFDGESSTPYLPDAPTNPLNVYGLTKLGGERTVLQTLPKRSVVLRTAWVYAAVGSNFLLTMLRVMKANGAVKVVADQIGTPTSANTLADVIWKIAGRDEITGVYHCTDAGVASWYDFAVAIAEEGAALGLLPNTVAVTPIAANEFPTRARRPGFSVLDKQSLVALGIELVHWRKALREVMKEIPRA